jgi:hypothetical protein
MGRQNRSNVGACGEEGESLRGRQQVGWRYHRNTPASAALEQVVPRHLVPQIVVARQHHGESPPPIAPPLPPGVTPGDFGHQLFLLQKWGKLGRPPLGPEDAREFLASLYVAAGPQRPIGRLLEMISKRYGIVDHEKIEWLRVQARKMAGDPQYYPQSRPEIVNRTNLDMVLKVVKEAPGGKADIAYIMSKTGKSRDSVVNVTRRLCAESELVRIAPGVFTLSGLGTAHIPAHKAIMAVMEPDTQYKAIELATMLGRPRGAIDAALHGHGALLANGKIMCVRRGVFALPPPSRH